MGFLLLLQLNMPLFANLEACEAIKYGKLPPKRKISVVFTSIPENLDCLLYKVEGRVFYVK